MHKIVVAGPVPYDHIETYQGIVREQYGCILYPTLALVHLFPSPSTIYPVTNVGEEDKRVLEHLLGLYPNMDLRGLRATPEGTDRIFLKYLSESERLERQTNKMKPITFDDLKDFINCDAFIFVPVTDFEVPFDTIKRLRENSSGLILFDAHGPTSTVDEDSNRIPKHWDDIEKWLSYIDVLKMNEKEAGYTSGKENLSKEDFINIAKEWVKRGPSQVIITLGRKGSLLVYRDDGIYSVLVPSIIVERVLDTTGVGDSFAAGYVYGLFYHKNPIIATMFGNAVAGQKVSFIGPLGYKSSIDTEIQVIFNYTPMLKEIQRGWKGDKLG
ncbi:MAG: carbohydrate kinase family protein [archaeon]|nr:carbohydrate kinase family protein [archaeon]MCP8320004.1 carbohydrate kinase family protein [archaeon]